MVAAACLLVGGCSDDGDPPADSMADSESSTSSASASGGPGSEASTTDPTMGTEGVTSSDPSASVTTDDSAGTEGTDSGGPPPVIDFQGLCFEAPPDGAEAPPALPEYSGAACPALAPGLNTMESVDGPREFILVEPSDLQPDEIVPVVFLWHWLGGDADSFLEEGAVQEAADQYRFVAVIPEDKDDLLFRWPFSAVDSDARAQEEYIFFDDMLACVAETYPIEPNCVSSVGVSAGALWTAQLAGGRGEYLSSIVSLSGGTGGAVKPWTSSMHAMPAFVLWGGPMDTCIVLNFEQTSADLEQNLVADGHSIIECVHNCAHSAPPFDVPDGLTAFAPMWEYVLDHPYWLEDGESPWDAGLPASVPPWCRMGAGNADIREGMCGEPSC